jgi:hypothetical protein
MERLATIENNIIKKTIPPDLKQLIRKKKVLKK